MKIDARIRQIWFVRSWLGPRGHLALVNRAVNPATDEGLRALLITACNWDRSRHPFADDRGLLRHAPGQLVDEAPAEVFTWQQVWDFVSPGITPERVAELNAAWAAVGHDRRGRHAFDDRLHLACCAFYQPPERLQVQQMDLFELLRAEP